MGQFKRVDEKLQQLQEDKNILLGDVAYLNSLLSVYRELNTDIYKAIQDGDLAGLAKLLGDAQHPEKKLYNKIQ